MVAPADSGWYLFGRLCVLRDPTMLIGFDQLEPVHPRPSLLSSIPAMITCAIPGAIPGMNSPTNRAINPLARDHSLG